MAESARAPSSASGKRRLPRLEVLKLAVNRFDLLSELPRSHPSWTHPLKRLHSTCPFPILQASTSAVTAIA